MDKLIIINIIISIYILKDKISIYNNSNSKAFHIDHLIELNI